MKINRIKSVLVEKDKSQTWLAEKLGKIADILSVSIKDLIVDNQE